MFLVKKDKLIGKKFLHDIPIYKLDKQKNKLVKVDGVVLNTFAEIEKNKTLTLKEMINMHISIENQQEDAKYFDVSNIPTDINEINVESRKDIQLSDYINVYNEKKQREYLEQEIVKKAQELAEKNNIENKKEV